MVTAGFFLSFLIISFLMLLAEQLVVRYALRVLRLEGYNYRNILLVGTGERASKIIDLMERNKGWGLKIIGTLHAQPEPCVRALLRFPVLGSLDDMVNICKGRPVDEVIFCDEARFDLADHIATLHEIGITARTVLDLYYRFDGKADLEMLHGEVPLMTFRAVSADPNQLFFKRCLDIVGACVGLAVSACVFPFIALAIKPDHPVLFSSARPVSGKTAEPALAESSVRCTRTLRRGNRN